MVKFGFQSNILESCAECLAIPVNTVGVAGAGLAKMAMPFGSDALKMYVRACRTRSLATGKVCIIETEINGKSVMLAESIGLLTRCDSACADGLRDVLAHATYLRQVDPDATRGAIDYTRGWLALGIGRLDRDARRQAKELYS